MVNEPLPHQLTVEQLRAALEHEQPNAVVGLISRSGVLHNLTLSPDNEARPVFKLIEQ